MALYLGNTLIAPIISDDTLPNSLNWMGKNAELVEANFKSFSTTLDQTTFPSWTPSTTAHTIVATTTTENFNADLENYEYIIEWLWDVRWSHKNEATLAAFPIAQFGIIYHIVHRRAYGEDSFTADIANRNYCTALFSSLNYMIYYNTSGTRTWTTSQSYGLYGASNVATLGSNTNLSTTFNPKTPSFNARCYSSYFATARAPEVDQEHTTLKYTGNVYRVKTNSSFMRHAYMNTSHLFAHPL